MELTVYLKQLKDTVTVSNRTYDYAEKKSYRLLLECKDIGCMEKHSYAQETKTKHFPAETRSLSNFNIALYNYTISKKVANAITHLIKLGHKKEEFFKNDPFQ